MRSIDARTRLCAVIGNPVGHSLSPAMHNAAFERAGLNYVYLAFDVSDPGAVLTGMRAMPGFRGLSVTIPHKRAVMEHLDEIDPMAERVGSVNTITNENGRLAGSTTDGHGALKALANAGVSLDDRNVLFLGTGGAVRAVAFAVAEWTQAQEITVLGRTRRNVTELVDDLRANTAADVRKGSLFDDLDPALRAHDVVIHGTSVGMHPDEQESLVPRRLWRPRHIVFDMVYRPYKTRLLEEAEEKGAKVIVGLEMLINQAVLQFERWTGVSAPHDAMRTAAISELAKPQ